MRYFVVLAVALGLSAPALPALAEGLVLHKGSSNSRNSLFRNQTSLLDTRLSSQYSTATRLKPKSAIEATIGGESGGNLRYSGRYKGEYLPVAKSIAAKHGVPEDLFLRLVQQESGWNPNAVSNKGAMGLAQLMPGTAAKLGVNPRDPHQNLEGGARYLSMMYKRFGNWRLALAAYNAGPEAVATYGGVPPDKETKNYVKVSYGG